jgi:hypothetical protein
MKTIAALLLTIAIALFPLSGDRALASLALHGQGPVHIHASEMGHAHSAVHAQAHLHGDHDAHAHMPALASSGASADAGDPCCGSGDPSACCSLACHAMAGHASAGVPALSRMTSPVRLLVMPLPRGSRFDGLLRPPRPA